jgi:hypothetical protein
MMVSRHRDFGPRIDGMLYPFLYLYVSKAVIYGVLFRLLNS